MELVKRIFNKEDFERILDFPKLLRDRVILHLLHDTGMRSGELLTLRVDDVDLDNRMVSIIDSKKYRRFTLPFTHKTGDLLAEYIPTVSGAMYLFPARNKDSRTGHMSIKNLQWRLKVIAHRSGLPKPMQFQPRDFRRWFARNWVIKKGSLTGLQQILRHKHLSTTAVYADGIRFHDEIRKEYAKVLGE